MLLELNNRYVIIKFTQLLYNLKNLAEDVLFRFESDKLLIQEFDNAHICLMDVKIDANWFINYKINTNEFIGINSTILNKVLSCFKIGHTVLKLETLNNGDKLSIIFDGAKENKQEFIIPCMDLNNEIFSTDQELDHDIDMVINTKYFKNVINELSQFHDEIKIKGNENTLSFISDGESCKMTTDMLIDDKADLEYSIAEGETVNITCNIKYLNIINTFNKLSKIINIHLGNDMPIKITYCLDYTINVGINGAVYSEAKNTDDTDMKSYVTFYLAPKVDDYED